MRVVEALVRAASRGVTCRAMADSLGSRALIRSKNWKRMRDAGVHLVETLPVHNPLLRGIYRRMEQSPVSVDELVQGVLGGAARVVVSAVRKLQVH